MQGGLFAFSLSAATLQLVTNIDNLVVLLGLLAPVGPLRTIGGYILAQALILAAAVVVALGAAEVMDSRVGYLGLVPIALGLFEIFRRGDGPRRAPRHGASLLLTTLLFISLSFDSFSVITPLLADSSASYRGAAIAGILLAVVAVALAGVALSRVPEIAGHRLRLSERVAPFVMIAAGLYVLWDSGTDMF